jgi:hypothetical protein
MVAGGSNGKTMAGFKTPDFNERTNAAKAAKQRALDLLAAKPAPDPEVVAARQAAAAAREAEAAQRSAARKAAIEEAKAAKIAARIAAEEEAAAKKAAKKPELTDAEKKAIRDAKYAARKARKH